MEQATRSARTRRRKDPYPVAGAATGASPAADCGRRPRKPCRPKAAAIADQVMFLQDGHIVRVEQHMDGDAIFDVMKTLE
mgnify:CR=1 FL=1